MFDRIKSKVKEESDLARVRDKHTNDTIVFCTGCYDILQSGHAFFFSQCREFGDILIVGIGRDEIIAKLKGSGRPVNPENNRLYLVAAMQDVDYAVLNSRELGEHKIDFKQILEVLRPDVFVVNSDDSDVAAKRALCDDLGIEIRIVERTVPAELEPTSTTRIIDKINFKYKAPLRIDFAGGWTDVPFIMTGRKGFVSNVTISPLIELGNEHFNFSGYPRGSGLSTSTAVKLLEMVSMKTYNSDAKTLDRIAEDLFNLENTELNWAIGRQDQYAIVFGGFNCFEFGSNYAKRIEIDIPSEILNEFKKGLVMLHTGASRNAQSVVEEVYRNHSTPEGRTALDALARLGLEFAETLARSDFAGCSRIMEQNFRAQKLLAQSTSNQYLDDMYAYAKRNGALGGKIAGAGGGGTFIFYCSEPARLVKEMKKEFVDCFEIDFDFHFSDIKALNTL
jgi:cytidyltransferase-like protein